MTKKKKLLKPLPGRFFSAVISIGCLAILWTSVLNHHAPSHGVAMMLLITSGFSSFHAFGWRAKYHWERWLLSPVGSMGLILITLILFFTTP